MARPDGTACPREHDLAAYVMEMLDAEPRTDFEAHLATCARCQHELQELAALPALLEKAKAAPEVVTPPAGLEAKVMRAIADEASRDSVVLALPTRARWRGLSWQPTLAAAAASLLIGLAVGAQVRPASPAPPAARVQTVQLVAAVGGAGQGVAEISPSQAGRSITLKVKGLPPSGPGQYYACWLVALDDNAAHQDRVQVGTFTVTPNGSATVHWETAADVSRFPTLGVTLEPQDGNPIKHGTKVLVQEG